MSRKSKWEYFKAIYYRYHQAPQETRRQILDEFCQVCGYNRKYAIRLLNGPPPQQYKAKPRTRSTIYGHQVISILASVWEAAGYPWSARLKALLPLWLPWIKKRFHLPPPLESQLLRISPATIDRRLKGRKLELKRKLYGRTKPGTLLKHHIPLKTEHWNVTVPGFTEVDLLSHSGNCADGEFIYSLNLTDIHTTWTETRAVMGKGQGEVIKAMEEIRHVLPFELKGIDSDNGSEFINYHLKAFCDQHHIQFTRSRPYKKDDNAHVEQKNWTHVRRLLGYVRLDSYQALEAMNNLYRNELRLFYNVFLPSVKLIRKEHIGSRIRRIYNLPQTPFERLCASSQANPKKMAELKTLRDTLNPFELSKTIDQKLERIYQLAHHRHHPLTASTPKADIKTNRSKPREMTQAISRSKPLTRVEQKTMKIISEVFGIPVYVKNSKHTKKP